MLSRSFWTAPSPRASSSTSPTPNVLDEDSLDIVMATGQKNDVDIAVEWIKAHLRLKLDTMLSKEKVFGLVGACVVSCPKVRRNGIWGKGVCQDQDSRGRPSRTPSPHSGVVFQGQMFPMARRQRRRAIEQPIDAVNIRW